MQHFLGPFIPSKAYCLMVQGPASFNLCVNLLAVS